MRSPAIGMLVFIVALGFVAGAAMDVWEPPGEPAWWKANAVRDAGSHARAHALYVEHAPLHGGSVDFMADVMRNHRAWQQMMVFGARSEPVAPLAPLEAQFAHSALPGEARLLPFLAGYVAHQGQGDVQQDALRDLAQQRPHVVWANRLYAADLVARGDTTAAVEHYLEEGRVFSEHRRDVDTAAGLLMQEGNWERVAVLVGTPGLGELFSPSVRFRLAVRQRDWAAAARWFGPAHWPSPQPLPLVLAGLAALGWLLFLLRLGQVQRKPRWLLALSFVAVALGVASVAPTMVSIAWQEEVGHLRLTGEPGRDVLYFLLGVGLREELAKLLCALPLLLLLPKPRARLDVLILGGLVGLGFAAEENVAYLTHGGAATALVRYLTANAFHIMLTGNALLAAWDGLRDAERQSLDASLRVLRQVAYHAAYDFFLTHDMGGGGMLHLVPFFLAAREFFGGVAASRDSRRDALELREFFVLTLASITALTYAYACLYVGPSMAAAQVAGGALGLAVVAYLFIREMAAL